MKEITLEQYRKSWKEENRFDEVFFSENDIQEFMKSSSSDLRNSYYRNIIFDLILKTILLLSLLLVMFLVESSKAVFFIGVLLIISFIAILWLWRFYQIILRMDYKVGPTKSVVLHHLEIHRIYIKSVFVIALTAPLTFISGSIFYLYLKYASFPEFHYDDFIVLFGGANIGYFLSLFSHMKQAKSGARLWETCLSELQNELPSMEVVTAYRKKRLHSNVMMLLIYLLGMAILLYILWRIGHS